MRRHTPWLGESGKQTMQRSAAKAWLKQHAHPKTLESLYKDLHGTQLVAVTLGNPDMIANDIEMVKDVYLYVTGKRMPRTIP